MAIDHDPVEDARDVFRVLETGDRELARRVTSPEFLDREAESGPPAR